MSLLCDHIDMILIKLRLHNLTKIQLLQLIPIISIVKHFAGVDWFPRASSVIFSHVTVSGTSYQGVGVGF
jgi:hypothetical protein